MYALVMFSPGPEHPAAALDQEHVGFIAELVRQNAILLGGDFDRPVDRFTFAYVLRCASLDVAAAVVAREPYVRERAYEPLIVAWRLVGVNTDAIDPGLAVTPKDDW